MNLYQEYFHFEKAPFSISPNPHCLFMSQGHREALTQMKLGLQQSGGFILLTGEVGTGKTTLCRKLLMELDERFQIALIPNPQLDSDAMLEAIADAFGFELPVAESRHRQLRAFEEKLKQAHQVNQHMVVVIDEAQNLSYEVLEMLRLLTNVETDTEKMLQIVLVGQPELLTLLTSARLRQLNQRVTARYHLGALSQKDVFDYVKFRVVAAGGDPCIFTRGAIRQLYRLSLGTPRIINLLCDQALLFSYERALPHVGAKEVRAAHKVRVVGKANTSGAGTGELPFVIGQSASKWPVILSGSVLTLGLIVSALILIERQITRDKVPTTVAQGPIDNANPKEPADEQTSMDELSNTLENNHSSNLIDSDRLDDHVQRLAVLWGISGEAARCDRLIEQGLRCLVVQESLDDLLALNRPALVTLVEQGKTSVWLLESRDDSLVTLSNAQGQPMTKRVQELSADYQKRALIIWRPPTEYLAPIAKGDKAQWVPELRQRLDDHYTANRIQPEETGWVVIRPTQSNAQQTNQSPHYDWILESQVKQFQEEVGLKADGIVGPKTWIRLQNQADIPSLVGAK